MHFQHMATCDRAFMPMYLSLAGVTTPCWVMPRAPDPGSVPSSHQAGVYLLPRQRHLLLCGGSAGNACFPGLITRSNALSKSVGLWGTLANEPHIAISSSAGATLNAVFFLHGICFLHAHLKRQGVGLVGGAPGPFRFQASCGDMRQSKAWGCL